MLDLVVVCSHSARSEDRVLQRSEVQPVQCLDTAERRFVPLDAFQAVGHLGISNLLALSAGRLLLATQDRLGVLAEGVLEWLPVPGLEDAHELANGGDDSVLVADASLDHAVVLSEGSLTETAVLRPPEPGTFHLNQALVHEGAVLGVVHDVQGRPQRGPTGLVTHGDGGVIDLVSGEVVRRGMRAPHSLRRVADRWLILDSGRRRLEQLDDRWQLTGSVELPAWGRGLVHDPETDSVWVGLSPPRPRYQRALGWKVQRRPRVVRIHLPSLTIVEQIEVDHAEQVNGVHLLPRAALLLR